MTDAALVFSLLFLLYCGSAEGVPTRLVPGPDRGRVEVFYNGKWGTVCDDAFGISDARVVCRSIGISSSYSEVISAAGFGQGQGEIWMDDLACGGSESNLGRCGHKGWGSHNCGHGEDVAVFCQTGNAVRLYPGPHQGRVEILYGGTWGTVCDDAFGVDDAAVVCRYRGFSARNATTYNPDDGSGTIWMDDVDCLGSETRLNDCSHLGWGTHNCGHGEDVGVRCLQMMKIRLVPGPHYGRLEVSRGGSWGTVCDDNFDENDAKVICRYLGYTTYKAKMSTDYDGGTGSIYLDEVSCSGNEGYLDQCGHITWGTHDCSHGEDVGVVCLTGNVYVEEINVVENTPLTSTCHTVTAPRLSYRWTLSGSYLGSSSTITRRYTRADSGKTLKCEVSQTSSGIGYGTSTVNVYYPPSLLESVTKSVLEGERLVLSLVVDSNPVPHLYEWKKDVPGSEFQTSSSPPVLTNIRRAQTGDYIIRVTNRMGSVNGQGVQNVNVNVLYPPQSAQTNITRTVFEGDSVHLTMPVDSNPTPHLYEWKKDVPGSEFQTSSSPPVLNNIRRAQTGDYIIRVTNRMGTAVGIAEGKLIQRLKLIVLYEPNALCPEKLTIMRNMSKILTCNVNGFPVPEITWTKENSSDTVQGSVLELNNVQDSDGGIYICTATNNMTDYQGVTRTGSSTCRTNVTVLYPPHSPKRSTTMSVFEGDQLTLSLPLDSKPAPHLYEWKKDVPGSEYQTSSSPPVLHNIRRSEAGDYIIRVTNRMEVTDSAPIQGQLIQRIEVHVLYPPRISCQREFVVVQGSALNMTCNVESYPESHIVWTKDDAVVSGDGEDYISIVDAGSDNSGTYTCIADNTMTDYRGVTEMSSESCDIRLVVQYPLPRSASGTKSVYEGETVTLSLPMSIFPEPHTYEWRKATSSKPFRTSTRPPTIQNVQKHHQGDYIVRISNTLVFLNGSATVSHGIQLIRLNILYKPIVECHKEQFALENTLALLHCDIDAKPRVDSVTWSQNWTLNPLKTSQDSSLFLWNVQRTDSGVYRCTARNTMVDYTNKTRTGSDFCETNLHVLYQPSSLRSDRKSVLEGDSITLSLPVDSNPAPHLYEWRKDVPGSEFQTSSSPPVLHNITRSETGDYIIRVTNRMNTTSRNSMQGRGTQLINIDVMYKPVVTCQGDHAVVENTKFHLKCQIDASPLVSDITWIKDKGNQILVNHSFPDLIIERTHKSDRGTYTCRARNRMVDYKGVSQEGISSCSIVVDVLYPPLSLKSSRKYLFEGETLNLSLQVDSNPAPHLYEWKKDVPGSEFETSSSPPVLHNISRLEAGDYIIRVTNRMNITKRNTILGEGTQLVNINILYEPVVVCERNMAVMENNPINLHCQIDASPMTSIVTWTKDGTSLRDQTIIGRFRVRSRAHKYDQGTYTCTTQNVMIDYNGASRNGTGSCQIAVDIVYPPSVLRSGRKAVFEGERVALSLPVDSNPAPHLYEWKKDVPGSEFQTSSSPPVLNISRSDAGDYIIKVTNRMNITWRNTSFGHGVQLVKLTVLHGAVVNCQGRQAVVENRTLILQCQVDATPSISVVTWIKRGALGWVKNTTDTHLVINTAQKYDIGTYICSTRNRMIDYRGVSKDGTGSCLIVVDVLYPPSQLRTETKTVFEGSDLILSLPVDSNPAPLRYKWRKHIPESEFITVNSPPILKNLSRSQTGSYLIRITNKMQVSDRPAVMGRGVQLVNVNVLHGPVVNCQRKYDVLKNKSFYLRCDIIASPPVFGITWTKDGKHKLLVNSTETVLEIVGPQEEDSGTYTCSASNTMVDFTGISRTGTGSCTIVVHVLYPPSSLESGTMHVFEGENVVLNLPVDSNPAPHLYEWKKDVPGSEFQTSSSPPVLHNISRSEAGDYIIRVSNRLDTMGSDTSFGHGVQLMKLTVLYNPVVSCKSRHAVVENNILNIQCQIEASPAVGVITWTKQGVRGWAKNTTDGNLVIGKSRRSDSGTYICSAINRMNNYKDVSKVGTGSCLMTVDVLYPPDQFKVETKEVLEGNDLTISLPIESNPAPHLYEWKKDVPGSEFQTSSSPPVLHNITRSEAGDYIIKITNKMDTLNGVVYGHGLHLVKLDVLYSPDLECSSDISVMLHSTTDLTVGIKSNPSVSSVVLTRVDTLRNDMTTTDSPFALATSSTPELQSGSGSGSGDVIDIIDLSSNHLQTGTKLRTMSTDGYTSSGDGSEIDEAKISDTTEKFESQHKRHNISDVSAQVSENDDENLNSTLEDFYFLSNSSDNIAFSGDGVISSIYSSGDGPDISTRLEDMEASGSGYIHVDGSTLQPYPTDFVQTTKRQPVKDSVIYANPHMEKVEMTDEGKYEFVATNVMTDYTGRTQVGTGSCQLHLHVLYPPPFPVSESVSVLEGSDLRLSRPPRCQPPPSLYRWRRDLKNTEYIESASPVWIRNISREDAGRYIIEVNNVMNLTGLGVREGRGTQLVDVTVMYPPIVTCTNVVDVEEMSNITLNCDIVSVPSHEGVIWSRDNTTIAKGDSSLTLTDISVSDDGTYNCAVSNVMEDSAGITQRGLASCSTRLDVHALKHPRESFLRIPRFITYVSAAGLLAFIFALIGLAIFLGCRKKTYIWPTDNIIGQRREFSFPQDCVLPTGDSTSEQLSEVDSLKSEGTGDGISL